MSRIQVDNIFDKGGSGAPSLPGGVVVTGVSTFSSASFSGASNFNNTINVGDDKVLNFGAGSDGRIFFENSANEFHVRVPGGSGKLTLGAGAPVQITNADGNTNRAVFDSSGATVTGILTANTISGSLQATNADFAGLLREGVKVTAGKLSDNTNINLDNGMAHLFTTTETTTATPNIMSATGINTGVQVGEAFSVSIIVSAAAAGYAATVHIDGASIGAGGGSLVWNGGEAPSAGGSSGKDYYTYNIIKTASSTYTVLGNVANFA